MSKNEIIEGFLKKNKKVKSNFKNNKRKFNESFEMQDNRAKRVSFKNFLQQVRLEESEKEFEEDVNED